MNKQISTSPYSSYGTAIRLPAKSIGSLSRVWLGVLRLGLGSLTIMLCAHIVAGAASGLGNATKPYAATQSTTGITATNATLNGMATPNGFPATAWFEWGASIAYDQRTGPVEVGAGSGVVPVSAGIEQSAGRASLSRPPRREQRGWFGDRGGAAVRPGKAGGRLGVRCDPGFSTPIMPPAGLTNLVALSAGRFHSLALRSDRTVTGWGWFFNGTTYPRMTVPATVADVIAIASGANHGLALRSNGSIVGWG